MATDQVHGLLNPVDNNDIVSPGELVGGDSILLCSSFPSYEWGVDGYASSDYVIGLVQGINITATRKMRGIYQIGKESPSLISSLGDKSINMASIITEETNMIYMLYKAMIVNRDFLRSNNYITEKQLNTLNNYNSNKIIEGLPRELMRIPFGLYLVYMSGDREIIQNVHLGHCMLESDSSGVEAGMHGVSSAGAIMWQKTTYDTK